MTDLDRDKFNKHCARLDGYTEFDYRADPFNDRVYKDELLVKINGRWEDLPDYWNSPALEQLAHDKLHIELYYDHEYKLFEATYFFDAIENCVSAEHEDRKQALRLCLMEIPEDD